MSPPKPTHPLAHLPDPPQNYIPCAPTKYWPSTMDEEQHSSQGNKWWWLVYLGPMQGAYATRATAVANVPSASKIENAIEYFDTLTDLNCGWKKSCFHRHGHCPVHFACASFRMLGTLHRRPRMTLLAALAAFRVLGLLRAFPEAGAKVESIWWVLTDKFVCTRPSTITTATALFCDAHGILLPSQHALKTLPPSSSPPAYSPPSRSLSPPVATRQRPCPDPTPSWEFSMSTGGKSRYNKPRLFACDNPPTPLRSHSPEPDHGVKTEPKPHAKTEPEPRVKLKSGVKQEVKLKPNLQHDVERSRSRSHAPVPLYDPDSESDDSMGVDAPDNFEDEEGSVAMELADFSPAASLAPSSVVMSPVISSLSSLSTSTSTRQPSPTASSQIPCPDHPSSPIHRPLPAHDAASSGGSASRRCPRPCSSSTCPTRHHPSSSSFSRLPCCSCVRFPPHVSINSSAHTSDPHAPGSAHTSLSTHDYPSFGLPHIDFSALPPRPNLRDRHRNQTACRIDRNTHLFYVSDRLGAVFVNRDWAEQDAWPYGVQYFSSTPKDCDVATRRLRRACKLVHIIELMPSVETGMRNSSAMRSHGNSNEVSIVIVSGVKMLAPEDLLHPRVCLDPQAVLTPS
ncbi:hypothetical protein B0H13DRAFT_2334952 [Mycena leptocephala]|nr:hypothetical protein B0H13DRAFT_2334952 [Mycena leptocephala]